MSVTLSIIIVNYNVKYFLEQCLHSVLAACKHIDAEIIVVDNASTDDSKTYLPNKFPPVQFLWLPKNIGFGRANNYALALAQGKYILFLNPDTIVVEDSFSICLKHFSQHINCGALGIRMVDGAGDFLPESKRGFPSISASFFKISGLSEVFTTSSFFAAYYAGHLPQQKANEVDVISGAFMMVPKMVLDITGGFDEAFFMYGEDIDLSYRIQKAGYKNYYLPQTTIVHFKGESTKKNSADYYKHFYGAMQLFVRKHYSLIAAIGMITAIKMLAQLSRLKVLRHQRITVQTRAHHALVISNAAQLNVASQLLQNASVPITITPYCITEIPGAEVDVLAIALKQQLQQTGADYIVFCTPSISYKHCITVMQQLGIKNQYLWHAKKSLSIVGSASKEGKAIVIHIM